MPIKTIEIPDGFELVQVDERNYKIVKKEELPKTWDDFCNTHSYKRGESWISGAAEVLEINYSVGMRRTRPNLLPNKEYAEAILALCQLIQLRDCYRQGWKPDYSTKNPKYIITYWESRLYTDTYSSRNVILSFQTEELRDEFYKNFKDLIEKIKPLFR